MTAPPFSIPPTMPRMVAVSRGSRTSATRPVAGLVAPSRRVDRSTASAAASSMSRSVTSRPTEMPASIFVSSPSVASACTIR
jgi:hypothetical protein